MVIIFSSISILYDVSNKGMFINRSSFSRTEWREIFIGEENVIGVKNQSIYLLDIIKGTSEEIPNFKVKAGLRYVHLNNLVVLLEEDYMWIINIDSIKYKNILTAIGHTDFPSRQPRLDQNGFLTGKEIYFVNIDKKLVFHMYDDRGLDIISAKKETLRPIYKKHNDWILDYDREQIDKHFE